MSCSRLAASVGYFSSVCCDDGPVGVDQVAAQRHARRGGVVFAQYAAHRVAVHVQLARDGPHAPMLDRVQTHPESHHDGPLDRAVYTLGRGASGGLAGAQDLEIDHNPNPKPGGAWSTRSM